MDLVIDVECLFGVDGGFVVKELAILSTSGHMGCTWSYQPPYEWENLPRDVRRRNNWASKYLHHIQWNEGSEPYEGLILHLVSEVSPEACVFVKGPRKAEFLSRLLNRPVVELGQLGCPRADKLPETLLKCENGSLGACHRWNRRCATVKCMQFVEWMCVNRSVMCDGTMIDVDE